MVKDPVRHLRIKLEEWEHQREEQWNDNQRRREENMEAKVNEREMRREGMTEGRRRRFDAMTEKMITRFDAMTEKMRRKFDAVTEKMWRRFNDGTLKASELRMSGRTRRRNTQRRRRDQADSYDVIVREFVVNGIDDDELRQRAIDVIREQSDALDHTVTEVIPDDVIVDMLVETQPNRKSGKLTEIERLVVDIVVGPNAKVGRQRFNKLRTAIVNRNDRPDINRERSYVVEYVIEVSNGAETRRATISASMVNLKDRVIEYANRNLSFGRLISWKLDGSPTTHFVNDNVSGFAKGADESVYIPPSEEHILGQELFASMDGDCVTAFKSRYGIINDDIYDGMRTDDFVWMTAEYGVRCVDNEGEAYDNTGDGSRCTVVVFNGHVLSTPNDAVKRYHQFNNRVYMDDSTFEELYINTVDDHEKVIHDINVYDGAYGRWLRSFRIANDTTLYCRECCETPTAIIKRILQPYADHFYCSAEKALSVQSGVAPKGSHAYDMRAAYITAFRSITKVPEIANFPVDRNRALRIRPMMVDGNDSWAVVTKPTTYCGVSLPGTLMFMSEAVRYGADIEVAYPIVDWKDADGEQLYRTIADVIEKEYPKHAHSTQYKMVTTLKKGEEDVVNEMVTCDDGVERNRYVDVCMRYAFGSMIGDGLTTRTVYTGNLTDIDDATLCGSRVERMTSVSFSTKPRQYVSLHLAMANRYREMLEPMLRLKPVAVNCDCAYFMDELDEIPSGWRYEGVIDADKVCAKAPVMVMNEVTREMEPITADHVDIVKGLAGSGKTTMIRDRYGLSDPLVIVPSYRLAKTVWKTTSDGDDVVATVVCYQTMEASHQLPIRKRIIIDEAFQMNPMDVNVILGVAKSFHIPITLVGDPYQLRPVTMYDNHHEHVNASFLNGIGEAKTACGTAGEVIKANHRNRIDYEMFLKDYGRATDKQAWLKGVYDSYMTQFEVDIEEAAKGNAVVYCYITNGDGATRQRYEQAYARYVEETKPDIVYVRCTRNVKVDGESYCNGIIYEMPRERVGKLKRSCFVVSNVYSIYTTQGQTMSDIRLAVDDREYYYRDIRMLYVIVSRLRGDIEYVDGGITDSCTA